MATKTKCPFCRRPMKFGLDAEGSCFVEHADPLCQQMLDNLPKQFMVLATKKMLADTNRLIVSRGAN
jgi:hypothetical protein